MEFSLNRFTEVNKVHLENGAELRKSSNPAKKIIGYLGPVAHMVMAYTFAPLAILVAMEDAEYSNGEGGYFSHSYRVWLEETNRIKEAEEEN